MKRGTVVKVRCTGKGCRPARLKVEAKRRGTLQLAGKLAAIRLRKGTRLELRITRAGTVGGVVRFSGRKRGIPTRRDLCLPPGGKPGALAVRRRLRHPELRGAAFAGARDPRPVERPGDTPAPHGRRAEHHLGEAAADARAEVRVEQPAGERVEALDGERGGPVDLLADAELERHRAALGQCACRARRRRACASW